MYFMGLESSVLHDAAIGVLDNCMVVVDGGYWTSVLKVVLKVFNLVNEVLFGEEGWTKVQIVGEILVKAPSDLTFEICIDPLHPVSVGSKMASYPRLVSITIPVIIGSFMVLASVMVVVVINVIVEVLVLESIVHVPFNGEVLLKEVFLPLQELLGYGMQVCFMVYVQMDVLADDN